MNDPLALSFSALGTIVYLLILRALDRNRRHKPAASAVLWGSFGLGMLSIPVSFFVYFVNLPGMVLAGLFPNSILVYQVFVVGISEELSKMITFVFFAQVTRQIHEPRDAMLQAAGVALGFSIVENYFYHTEYGLGIIGYRLIFSTPGHMLYAAIWGSALAKGMFRRSEGAGETPPLPSTDRPYRTVFITLGAVAVIHGTFNTLNDMGLPDAGLATDLIAGIAAAVMLHTWAERSPFRNYSLSRHAEAIPALVTAIGAQPGNPVLRRRIGVYYIYAGEYDRAAYHLTQAIKQEPGRLLPRFYRGLARFLAGRRDAGSQEMSTAYAQMADATRKAAERNIGRLVRDGVSRRAAFQAAGVVSPAQATLPPPMRYTRRRAESRVDVRSSDQPAPC